MGESDERPHDGRRDVARAVAEPAERLPPALQPLARLAFNYRWSWTCGGAAVFRDIDPPQWCSRAGEFRGARTAPGRI